MSRANAIAFNTAVLDALGIDWKDQQIQSVRIDLNGPNIPTATITRLMASPLPGTHRINWGPETVISQKQMVSAEPISFDIDAACDAARAAVAETIERATRRAHKDIRETFLDAKLAMTAQAVCRYPVRPVDMEKPWEGSNFVFSPKLIGMMASKLVGVVSGIAIGLAICGLRRSA